MFLCAAFIKQMDATQEAERKSMNKSQALAGASHDIRASLAAITAWIELSRDCNTDSVLQANLSQMHACTKDLLGNCSSSLSHHPLCFHLIMIFFETEAFDLYKWFQRH